MKAYQKPAMLVLSISANDMLCSGCTGEKLKGSFLNEILAEEEGFDQNGDGVLSKEEADRLFGHGEECQAALAVTQYCKFTGDATFSILWS